MLNRRAFLQRLGLAGVAVAAAPLLKFLPTPAPVPVSVPIAVRMVQQWDVAALPVQRFDVIYGWATLQPQLACRITA